MPSPDETKVLKILDAEGGESTLGKVARKMGLNSSYARVILNSMGKNDIIDVYRNGKIRIAYKGWMALGKKREKKLDGFKRYMEDREKMKAF